MINKELANKAYAEYGKSKTMGVIYRDVFGDEYPEEAAPFAYSYLSQTELRRIAGIFGILEGQTIVDIGCGHGGLGLWVAREISSNLIGVDFSDVAIEIANKRIIEFGLEAKAGFRVGDFCETGLNSANYDGAISIDTLVFVPNTISALRETARILKNNASFIFTTWEIDAPGMLKDHKPLLEKADFEVVIYEEAKDWKIHQRGVGEGILASQDALFEEMSKSSAEAIISEAKSILSGLNFMRRIFVVARKK